MDRFEEVQHQLEKFSNTLADYKLLVDLQTANRQKFQTMILAKITKLTTEMADIEKISKLENEELLNFFVNWERQMIDCLKQLKETI